MTAREVLIEARRIIAEKGWTQGTYAKNCHGGTEPRMSENAVSFCALGAIYRSAPFEPLCTDAEKLFGKAITRPSVGAIKSWNDAPRRTKREVLAAFDRAIKLAGAP